MVPFFITIMDYHGEQRTLNLCEIIRFRKIQTNQKTFFVTIESNTISNTDVTVQQYEAILELLNSWSKHKHICVHVPK